MVVSDEEHESDTIEFKERYPSAAWKIGEVLPELQLTLEYFGISADCVVTWRGLGSDDWTIAFRFLYGTKEGKRVNYLIAFSWDEFNLRLKENILEELLTRSIQGILKELRKSAKEDAKTYRSPGWENVPKGRGDSKT